jgi:hypothetical protein
MAAFDYSIRLRVVRRGADPPDSVSLGEIIDNIFILWSSIKYRSLEATISADNVLVQGPRHGH